MASYDRASVGPFTRVGVVGCGRVGRTICHAIDRGVVAAHLSAVYDTDARKVEHLVFDLKRPTRSMALRGLAASVDIVIEATNRHAAPVIMMAALDAGKDLLVTNTAAVFARDDFARLAHERGLTILVANPLLTGDTALRTAAAMPGATAKLTLTCSRDVLADAPFLRGRALEVGNDPQLVFQGEPADVMAAFPALANLAAAAAIGAGDMQVLVRIQAHANTEVTDIELTISADQQQTTAHARLPSAGKEPVHPEVIGMAAVGVLRSLVSSLRLA